MKPYRLSSSAKKDIAAIRHYISLDKPSAADQQIAKFFRAFQMLAQNTELGQRCSELGDRLRIFSLGSYVVVYRPFEAGVEIIRVLSGCQNVESLFR